jgi:lysyl-tRNA synthetase class 2
MELNEIVQQRKERMLSLQAKGLPIYGSSPEGRSEIQAALEGFAEGKTVCLCGRLSAMRGHGKVVFADLRDASGKIQLYFKADIVGQERFGLLKEVDIADIICAEGELFKTHSAEPTVKVREFSVLVKALRPPPEKWHGLKDVELRFRQRYLDLIANEEARKVFLLRQRIISGIRKFFDGRGFLEVETPMLHPLAGGAAGRPFKTLHNEYGLELYLRIAPELYLKRLLVGGFDRVYEINRSFRNEGVSTRHNPEFTMLEAYEAYSDYAGMMRLTEELISSLARELLGKEELVYQGKKIGLAPAWQRRSFAALVKEKFAINPEDSPAQMLEKLQRKGFAKDKNRLTRSQINKIIEESLEQEVSDNPVFITDYFTALCPLAKTRADNPLISERFELYIAGMEVANAYSELNNPLEQRRRFAEEIKELPAGEKRSLDEDYCLALEHGMPPAGGLGLGIDRLAMLFADQPSIREVILFPLLRPTKTGDASIFPQ